MLESASSQSSTPTPYNETNVSCNGSTSQWSQLQSISPDIGQNGVKLKWREIPGHDVTPVPMNADIIPSVRHITNDINNFNRLNQQTLYNPPTYANIPYQRRELPNGYIASDITRGINGQVAKTSNFMRTQNGQIISGSNWPNQSLIGRYITPIPTWTSNKTSGGVKKQKRIRTAFTTQQTMALEQEYARTRYLDRARRIELADILRLNERTIKIWFQNRRMKEKKDRVESLEGSEEGNTSELSPEMTNNQLPMLIHEQYQSTPNEMYNLGGTPLKYMEPFPTSSTSTSMPVTSLATIMPHNPVPLQNVYQEPHYNSEEQYHCQHQQIHFQVQHYPSPYGSEVQEMTLESVPQAEVPSTTHAPSDIIEKSWDLTWIKSIQIEDDC